MVAVYINTYVHNYQRLLFGSLNQRLPKISKTTLTIAKYARSMTMTSEFHWKINFFNMAGRITLKRKALQMIFSFSVSVPLNQTPCVFTVDLP